MSETTINLESYPPMFQQQTNQTTQKHEPDDHNRIQETDPIPLIDLQSLNPDNLAQACKDWALFRLVNHGVPSTLLNQLQHLVTKIFDLSFESKQALFETSPVSYFWGTSALTPSGSAYSRGPENMNWVEGFNVPLCKLSQLEQDEEDPMLCSLRLLMEEYRKHMARIARALFEAMEMGLKLDPEQSKSKLSEPTGLARIYRYPICHSREEAEAWGIHKHTDSSVLSIVAQFEVGGLEVFKDDKWILARPILDTLIVNLGDMMQAISNDEYKSAIHRVKVSKYKERNSICYFVFPEENYVIQSSNYKPFTYRDFQAQVQKDVKNLGSKVGLERFRFYGPVMD
ncbi:gibberellin 2-beta-dioxygenase 8 [Tripterygium wilfordii]|uniref:Gibberellin 2-beta-dioxygenase 8 n=1 Tax=Tripterygium wilfordii TaxID=458696 RepID=A0A7J7CV48_TRIWF|nr:gibberellin 2-beta-dioxygenase 8 [Tripterygium wilfordii]KAF5737977.1 gibberellin 2-beta-dioxygenase 8 [Tripterygium wilfordii]